MYVKNASYTLESLSPEIDLPNKSIEKPSDYLEFSALTLVPYAKELIDTKILSKEEKDYIKQYYQKIKNHVHPLLSTRAKKWLESQLFLF